MRGRAAHRAIVLAAAVVGGVLLALIASACDGNDQATPTPLPTVAPGTPTATAEYGSALPLQRYHYVASFTLQTKDPSRKAGQVVITTEGDYESPDRHAFVHTVASGDDALRRRLVLIDNRAWVKTGGGPWRTAAVGDAAVVELLGTAFSPAREGFLGGERYEEVRDAARRLPATEERVNGVPTYHYRVSEAGLEFFETFLVDKALLANAEDFSWDLWLAQDGGWPVRLRASSTVTEALRVNRALEVPAPAVWELQIDISRPDDPRLAVRPPVEKG